MEEFMLNKNWLRFLAVMLVFELTIVGCASNSGTTEITGLISLDNAMTEAIAYIEARTNHGDTIALSKIASPQIELSDFLNDEFINRFNNNGNLVVVVRGRALESINEEQQFQLSGMVSDASAVGIGRFLGAKVVLTGDLVRFANFTQLSIRVVEVETAILIASYFAKINEDDPIIAGITGSIGNTGKTMVTETALNHFNLGKEYLAAGLPDLALSEFNRSLSRNRNFTEALFHRGIAHYNRAEYVLMESYAPAMRPDGTASRSVLESYGRNARSIFQLAISDFTAVLRNNPNNADAYFNRGLAYFYSGQIFGGTQNENRNNLDLAIADFTHVIRINPNSKDAYIQRGRVYQRIGGLLNVNNPSGGPGSAFIDRAISDYTIALRIDPDDAIVQRMLEEIRNRWNR